MTLLISHAPAIPICCLPFTLCRATSHALPDFRHADRRSSPKAIGEIPAAQEARVAPSRAAASPPQGGTSMVEQKMGSSTKYWHSNPASMQTHRLSMVKRNRSLPIFNLFVVLRKCGVRTCVCLAYEASLYLFFTQATKCPWCSKNVNGVLVLQHFLYCPELTKNVSVTRYIANFPFRYRDGRECPLGMLF